MVIEVVMIEIEEAVEEDLKIMKVKIKMFHPFSYFP